MQAMPVKTVAVTLQPVAQSSEYMATIKSRRSATILPQVNGLLTKILVHSGERVKAGQALMEIDPRQQQAQVASQGATERQKKALLDYDAIELDRQRKLFAAGVTSKDALDQAQQAYDNAKADYEAARQTRNMQEQQLAYYTVRAPFDGVVGDIPVHLGDYVSPLMSPTAMLTTVDQPGDLEAYIYIPTERSDQVRTRLAVELYDTSREAPGEVEDRFCLSAGGSESARAFWPRLRCTPRTDIMRNAQLIKAQRDLEYEADGGSSSLGGDSTRWTDFRVRRAETARMGISSRHRPAVTSGRHGGECLLSSSGLNAGDQVVISSTQFLVNGMPVSPIPG